MTSPAISVTITGMEPQTLKRMLKALGISPDSKQVTVHATDTDQSEALDWTPEVARMFVNDLRENAYRALTMVCDGGGVVSLDEVIETLGLPNGKALGGVMSSIGHNIRGLVETGLLPEGTRVIERYEEAREFRAVCGRRVLNLLTTAVHRRAQMEGGRPQAVAS